MIFYSIIVVFASFGVSFLLKFVIQNYPLWLKQQWQNECESYLKSSHHSSNPKTINYLWIALLTLSTTFTLLLSFNECWQAFMAMFFTWALIGLSFIDIREYLLPDQIIFPLLWIGLLINLFTEGFTTIQLALIGVIAGYASLWLLAKVYELIKNILEWGMVILKC